MVKQRCDKNDYSTLITLSISHKKMMMIDDGLLDWIWIGWTDTVPGISTDAIVRKTLA